MKKQTLSRKAYIYCLLGSIWCFSNFVFMIGNALRNGTVAFPGGRKDELGYFVIDHGERFDFTLMAFEISYWQGLITFISFPVFLLGVFILHATGDIKKVVKSNAIEPNVIR